MNHQTSLLASALRVCSVLAVAIASATNAFALTPELAKKCRDMALTAYPYQLPGTGPGNAKNEISFYKDCVAKNGDVVPPSPTVPR